MQIQLFLIVSYNFLITFKKCITEYSDTIFDSAMGAKFQRVQTAAPFSKAHGSLFQGQIWEE